MADRKKFKLTFKPGTIRPDMKTMVNEPFFVKKAEASKKMVEKYGFPKEWLEDLKAASGTVVTATTVKQDSSEQI